MNKASRSSAFAAAVLFAAGASFAQIQSYSGFMDGPSEAPPNGSPGFGLFTIDIDMTAITMTIHAEFAGLVGNTTAAHIHGPTTLPQQGTAGVATQLPSFTGFPLGVTSGVYDHVFDMTDAASYNPAFITASGGTVGQAFSRLVLALDEQRAYLNIHSSSFPGGEIRGFVPAPGTAALIALGGLAAGRRRRA